MCNIVVPNKIRQYFGTYLSDAPQKMAVGKNLHTLEIVILVDPVIRWRDVAHLWLEVAQDTNMWKSKGRFFFDQQWVK